MTSIEYRDRYDTITKMLNKTIVDKYSLEKARTILYVYLPQTIIGIENYKLYLDTTIHNRTM